MHPIIRQYGRGRNDKAACATPIALTVSLSPAAGQSETPVALPVKTSVTDWATVFRSPAPTAKVAGNKRGRRTADTSSQKIGAGVARLDFDARSSATKTKGLTQLVLDVGQRFVEHRPCNLCGMIYGHGIPADESTHARWCKGVQAVGGTCMSSNDVGSRGGRGGGAPASREAPPLLELTGWRTAGRVVSELVLPRVSPATAVTMKPTTDIRRHFRPLARGLLPAEQASGPAVTSSPLKAPAVQCPSRAPGEDDAPSGLPLTSSCAQPSAFVDLDCRGADLQDTPRGVDLNAPASCSIVAVDAHAAPESLLGPVRRLLDAELGEGSCPLRRHSSSRAPHPSTLPPEVCYFIGVAPGGRLVGVVVTERVSAAYRVRVVPAAVSSPGPAEAAPDPSFTAASVAEPQRPTQGAFSTPLALGSALDLTSPEPAALGVAQVWVAGAVRRRGVARALLDAARSHAVYGYTVPRSELAFSQTTATGALLAADYSGRPDFLVYV